MRLPILLFSGIMAGLAASLQTAPIWLGQPVGFALAILASLPMALAAWVGPRTAALALTVAALLCALFQPEEGWIFALTNGPFGLALGFAVRMGHAGWRGVLLPALALLAGMAILTWGVGVAPLGPGAGSRGLPFTLAGYALFALLWSALFTPLVRLLVRRARPALELWTRHGPEPRTRSDRRR